MSKKLFALLLLAVAGSSVAGESAKERMGSFILTNRKASSAVLITAGFLATAGLYKLTQKTRRAIQVRRAKRAAAAKELAA